MAHLRHSGADGADDGLHALLLPAGAAHAHDAAWGKVRQTQGRGFQRLLEVGGGRIIARGAPCTASLLWSSAPRPPLERPWDGWADGAARQRKQRGPSQRSDAWPSVALRPLAAPCDAALRPANRHSHTRGAMARSTRLGPGQRPRALGRRHIPDGVVRSNPQPEATCAPPARPKGPGWR